MTAPTRPAPTTPTLSLAGRPPPAPGCPSVWPLAPAYSRRGGETAPFAGWRAAESISFQSSPGTGRQVNVWPGWPPSQHKRTPPRTRTWGEAARGVVGSTCAEPTTIKKCADLPGWHGSPAGKRRPGTAVLHGLVVRPQREHAGRAELISLLHREC